MSKDEKGKPSLKQRVRVFNKHVTNPLLRRFAHASRGPFAILRHVGRTSGKPYETTIMAWPLGDTFVIALTYGEAVDWYRNVQAAGGGTLHWHGREFTLGKPEPIEARRALQAFPALFRLVLGTQSSMPFIQMKKGAAPAPGKP